MSELYNIITKRANIFKIEVKIYFKHFSDTIFIAICIRLWRIVYAKNIYDNITTFCVNSALAIFLLY